MEPKRLFRSKRDRMIGGVCGGLGNYFNVDPVIIRVVTVAMFFAGFLGLLGYIIAWIIVPEDPAV